MGKDYYALLSVDKNADEDAIKKAYKKAALRWHPDRNQGSQEASKKFQDISEAFEVLSDKQKRTIYDQFGEEGLKGGGGPPPGAPGGSGGFDFSQFAGAGAGAGGGGPRNFRFATSDGSGFSPTDPSSLFEQIFGAAGSSFGNGGSPFSAGSNGTRRRGAGGPSASGLHFGDNDDPMSGGGFSSFAMPGGMGGMGGGGPSIPRTSPSQSQKPPDITKPLKVSLNDLYSGTTKHLKIGRKLRDGRTEEKVLKVDVVPGWKEGTKVRFPKSGNETPSGESQDLVFVVEEKQHARFSREGSDLVTQADISLLDALTGSASGQKKIVEQLDGRKLQVTLPFGIVKPGQVTVVAGEGMPVRKKGSTRSKGDLIVKWNVVFPDRVTDSQKEGLKKVFA